MRRRKGGRKTVLVRVVNKGLWGADLSAEAPGSTNELERSHGW